MSNDLKTKEQRNFKEWYEKNKAELSLKRKQKYKMDAEYRDSKKTESSRYYWLKKRRAVNIGTNKVDMEDVNALQPDEIIYTVVSNQQDIRYGNTIPVPVYYVQNLEKLLRRSSQTVRLWFSRKYLNDVFRRNVKKYRLFTKDQMEVFAENRHWLSFSVKDFEHHPFFRMVNDGMSALDANGLKPMLADEWRIDPSMCPFCKAHESLQRKIDGEWVHVECFSCKHSAESNRNANKKYLVAGECTQCGNIAEKETYLAEGEEPVMECRRCGKIMTINYKNEV